MNENGAVMMRDGRRVHVERLGACSPTVVFEAGMGVPRNSGVRSRRSSPSMTATVVYDRSGLGQSPPDPPATSPALVDDLVDVLGHLGDGPFVLVGHSWGGPIIRVRASRVPERIAGLVLVDQTDEGCELFFSKANEWQTRLDVAAPPAAGPARPDPHRRQAARQVAPGAGRIAARRRGRNRPRGSEPSSPSWHRRTRRPPPPPGPPRRAPGRAGRGHVRDEDRVHGARSA